MNISDDNRSLLHTSYNTKAFGKYKVYFLLDSFGDVFYVGATCRAPQLRKNQHISDSRRKTKAGEWKYQYHISRKLRKLEWKFYMIAPFSFSTKEEMYEAEKYYIKLFRALGCDLANITEGGNGGGWSENKKCSDELRARLRQMNIGINNPNYGKSPSIETRNKQRQKMQGRAPAHMLDPILKSQTAVKISQTKKGKGSGCDNPNWGNCGPKSKLAKILLQLDLVGNVIATYVGLKEAARILGYNEREIRKVITGERDTYKGFIWKYQ